MYEWVINKNLPIAYQNRIISSLKDRNYSMKDINKIPFEEISKRINNTPIKKFEFHSSIKEFRKIILHLTLYKRNAQ